MLHRLTLTSKRLCALLLAFCAVSAFMATSSQAVYQERLGAPAETIIASDITTDTTWTLANSPYRVTKEIYVKPGVTLTIEPGVTVWVEKELKIHAEGGATIIAKGTPDQPITFDRYRNPSTGLAPRWKKIHLHPNSTSYFRYVDFAYGGASSNESTILHFEGLGTHVLNMCTVRDSKLQGITAQGDSLNLTVAGTLFEDNGRWSLAVDSGADVVVTGSTFDVTDHIAVRLRDKGAGPATITISDSNMLSDGSSFVVYNEMAGSVSINARNNWWGQASGPHAGAVTAGVSYTPWLTAEADRVGITTPPNASFTVDPDPTVPRPLGTVYTFDASASTDDEDYTASLEVCWDWDNDGTCDTAYSTVKTATHSLTDSGMQTVRLVVRDTDSDTDEATQGIQVGDPPIAAFTFIQPTWAQVAFDASGSTDTEDASADLEVAWDYEGDGDLDTTYTTLKITTHTYPHLGRYWPTLYVKDTDNLTDTLRKSVDIIPPATTVTITGSGGTLDSVDQTVQVTVYADTVGGDVISNGLAITHTPWLTLPHNSLPDTFLYQGFSLGAWSVGDGQPINEISGTYTITISYDCDYFAGVLNLPPFEHQLRLYRWDSGTPASWTLVDSALYATTDQLVATTGFFGDFALAMDVRRVYLPLIARAN